MLALTFALVCLRVAVVERNEKTFKLLVIPTVVQLDFGLVLEANRVRVEIEQLLRDNFKKLLLDAFLHSDSFMKFGLPSLV